MPVPRAVMSARISSLPSILSARAFSTFRILPLSGRIALDDDELALLGVALGAVRELAREREAVERPLAQNQVARLARRLARAESGEALLDDATRILRVLLEVLAERVVHRRGHLPRDLGVAETRLGLTLELRLADLHADDRGQTFANVVRREVRVGVLQLSVLARVGVDRPREGVAEARQVGAAVGGADVVRERVDLLDEAVVVLERDLDHGAVLVRLLDVDRLVVQHLVRPIQVADERHDAAVEVVVRLVPVALVVQREEETLVQVRGLT